MDLPSASEYAVSMQQATVEFSGGARAIDSVDLLVPAAQRLAIVGQSGCGKTTLLRVIAGLQKLTDGCLHTNGLTADDEAAISFVFQQPALLPWRRVTNNVTLPLELQDRKQRPDKLPRDKHAAATAALREVELSDVADRFPHQLSGGMKMRVSIARALVTEPRLLLLDEPFAALDDLLRTQLGNLVMQLWQTHQFTMVLVTHNIAEAIALSDRICVMHAGRIVADLNNPISLSKSDVRRTAAFAEFYGVVSDHLRAAVLR
jgi:ABC-type nitrate/sulfonate/bicarbonate transport system ATPase subunit